ATCAYWLAVVGAVDAGAELRRVHPEPATQWALQIVRQADRLDVGGVDGHVHGGCSSCGCAVPPRVGGQCFFSPNPSSACGARVVLSAPPRSAAPARTPTSAPIA